MRDLPMMYCEGVLRLLLCVGLLASTAFAQWPRYVTAVKGDENTRDSPPAHPLAYFKMDPRSRPNDDRLCIQLDLCWKVPSTSELAERANTHTDLRVLGKVGVLTIYELDYFLGGGDGTLDVKSILVETAADQLHEIHVQQHPLGGGGIAPSELLDAGTEKILKTKYDDGGNRAFVHEDYFTFSESGADLIDFKLVFEAAEKVIPSDMAAYQPTEVFDFGKLLWTIATEKRDLKVSDKLGCCEGRVSVKFRLENGRVLPTDATYDPDWHF